VSIGAILGEHGSRSGPSPAVIRRATVLVSRDALASEAEMNYWNFFAQRLADPNRTGVPSYAGYVSFDRATGNTIDLRTDVAPTAGGPLGTAVEVTSPRFGRKDLRGLEFNETVPSRFVAGQRVTLTGRITATEHADYNNLAIRFWKYGGNTDNAVLFWATVTRSGTFTVNIDLSAAQRGIYAIHSFLYWPGGSAAQRVGYLTPILVE
jgi:hypothetical protein